MVAAGKRKYRKLAGKSRHEKKVVTSQYKIFGLLDHNVDLSVIICYFISILLEGVELVRF